MVVDRDTRGTFHIAIDVADTMRTNHVQHSIKIVTFVVSEDILRSHHYVGTLVALLPRAGSILIDEVKDLAVVSIVATLVDVAILVVVTDLQVVDIKTGTITINVMSTMLKIITMMMTI